MSPRRPPPRPPRPERHQKPEAKPGGALLRKYQELTTKHEALVQRLEARNDEHISTYRLSSWALETTETALVQMRVRTVLMANRRWHALARSGPWQRLEQGRPTGPLLATLREVVGQEIDALLGTVELGARVQLYQKHESNVTLEVRVDRAGPLSHVSSAQMVLALVHDVTQQALAAAELEQARAAMARQEHLRALGEMSSGIAHDLNNTLNAMRLRLEMLQRDPELVQRHAPHLRALIQIVSDAGTRVRHLQEFSRQRFEPSQEESNLGDIIQAATELARDNLEPRAKNKGAKIHIVNEVPALPTVNGEPADLRYVFLNLLLNARDAMPQGGTIFLRGALQGTQVAITVEDEGTGIPEAHLGALFRPFFTTKGNKGTGLGLSMAYGVVSRAGGTITAGNRPQGGAIFTLTFPLYQALLEAPLTQAPPLEVLPHLKGRVLLIDDDAGSREALVAALESLGVSVDTEADGTAALKRARKRIAWDVVLCDLNMPDMTGWTVAGRLEKIAPQLPFYLVTGNAPSGDKQTPRPPNVRGLLAKPLTLRQLAEALERVLPGVA
jgi:signal transduction histidine kinase